MKKISTIITLVFWSILSFASENSLVIEYPLHTPVKLEFKCIDNDCNPINFTKREGKSSTQKVITKDSIDAEIESLAIKIQNEKERIEIYNQSRNQQAWDKTILKENMKKLKAMKALVTKLYEGKKNLNVSVDVFYYMNNFFQTI